MNRLRKLDAMFAERVLGHQLGNCPGDVDTNDDSGMTWWCDSCKWCGSHAEAYPHQYVPAKYTRSLDAAWAAILGAYPGACFGFDRFCEEDREGGPAEYMGYFAHKLGSADKWASHPAEALVRAALAVVGVTEDKITACDVD